MIGLDLVAVALVLAVGALVVAVWSMLVSRTAAASARSWRSLALEHIDLCGRFAALKLERSEALAQASQALASARAAALDGRDPEEVRRG